MKAKTTLGSLLVSVALCSPGFGFELMGRLLGLQENCDGKCSTCAPCAPACRPCAPTKTCAPATCEKPCRVPLICKIAAGCKPAACNAPCGPTACKAPSCGPTTCEKPCRVRLGCATGCDCGCGCKHRFTPVRDLLDKLVDMFRQDGCCDECDCGDNGVVAQPSAGGVAPAPVPFRAPSTPARNWAHAHAGARCQAHPAGAGHQVRHPVRKSILPWAADDLSAAQLISWRSHWRVGSEQQSICRVRETHHALRIVVRFTHPTKDSQRQPRK